MSDIAAQFNTMLIKSGFQEMPPTGKFSSIGNFYCLPESFGEGIYWIYGEKNLFNMISIFTRMNFSIRKA